MTTQRTTRRGVPDLRQSVVIDRRVETIARRLSYSPEPLAPAQKEILADWMRKSGYSEHLSTNIWKDEDFLQQARTTLSPQQQAALDELRVESEVSDKRCKLPKADVVPSKGKPSG